ncbi:MAG: CvpA family protein [Chloroflexi bacterium]|nr:CvpA family protein [Chloroflexota bacterium]
MGLNWFDVAVALGMLWWISAGLASGFIREVIGVGGLILGFIVAGKFYGSFASVLVPAFEVDIARIASFVIIVFTVTLIAHWIGSLLHKTVSMLFLGWADHLLGGIFGAVKGLVIFAVLIAVLTKVPFLGIESGVRESVLAKQFLDFLPLASGLLPDLFEVFQSLLRKLPG